MRRKCSAWSRISRGGQVAPELHRAGRAERARQRAARLRGDADRAAAVAVAHQHGLDRAAVVGVEQRLDRAVARVRLVGERRASRTAPSPASRSRSAGGQVGHLVVAGGAARGPAPHLAGAEGGLAGVGERARRGARGPSRCLWWQPRCGSPSTSPTPGVASRRAAEQLIVAGRVTVGGEVVRDPARDVDGASAIARRRRGRSAAPSAQRAVYVAQQAGRRRLDRARHPRPPDGRRPRPRRPRGSTRSAASTPTRPGLILLTDDGELAHRLTHPRFEVPKTYRARRAQRAGARAGAARAARGRRARRRPHRARARSAARARRARAHASTRAASARCGGCARRSATASSRSSASRFGPLRLGDLPAGRRTAG